MCSTDVQDAEKGSEAKDQEPSALALWKMASARYSEAQVCDYLWKGLWAAKLRFVFERYASCLSPLFKSLFEIFQEPKEMFIMEPSYVTLSKILELQ